MLHGRRIFHIRSTDFFIHSEIARTGFIRFICQGGTILGTVKFKITGSVVGTFKEKMVHLFRTRHQITQ